MNLSWSLRKLKTLKYRDQLILDVGSGGAPNPLADILLERYADETSHRFHKAVFDRPTILGDAQKMPFKDKVFGYSVAFHVLEHVECPDKMLVELERTSSAGYIETPNVLHERLFPYPDHIWNLYLEDKVGTKTIVITPKRNDECFGGFHDSGIFSDIIGLRKTKPEIFHMQYDWKNKIHFRLEGDAKETSDATTSPNHLETAIKRNKLRRRIQSKVSSTIGKFRKNKEIDLEKILMCVECGSDVKKKNSHYYCQKSECGAEYPIDPFPDFTCAC